MTDGEENFTSWLKKREAEDGWMGCSFKTQPQSGTGTPCITHLSGHPCMQQNCPSLAPGRQSATYQVKLLLQLFISVIDAELFKAVDIKGLKTETQLVEQIKKKAGTGPRCSLAFSRFQMLNLAV